MSALDTEKLEFNVAVWVPCSSSALRIGQRIQIYSHEWIVNEFLEVLDLDEGQAQIVKRKINTQLVRNGGSSEASGLVEKIVVAILAVFLFGLLGLIAVGIAHVLWTGNPNWP